MVGAGRSRIAVERPTSRLSKRITWKPRPASSAQKSSCQAIICVARPITSSSAGCEGSPKVSYAMSMSPTRQVCSAMVVDPTRRPGRHMREAAEDGLRERPLAREVAPVRGAPDRLLHPRLRERRMPLGVPVLERRLVELGMKLHAPRPLPDPEALPRAGRRAQELGGARRQREAVLVPVDPGGA